MFFLTTLKYICKYLSCLFLCLCPTQVGFIHCDLYITQNNNNFIKINSLQTTTATSALPASGVGRDRRDILNASNFHVATRQSSECTLGTRSWRFRLVASGSAQFDVQGGDSQGLALFSYILSLKIIINTLVFSNIMNVNLLERPT